MNGKYGDLIKKARRQETQKTEKPENKITGQPETQNNEPVPIQKTKKPDNQTTKITEMKSTSKPDNQNNELDKIPAEPEVNLCIKVPKYLRQHWAAEAKRHGITMTSVIMEALEAKFGKPERQ